MYTILLLLSSLLLAAAEKSNVTTASETSSSSGSNPDRVVGGNLAKLGQFPYQAYIIVDSKTFCGGSLINQNTILTAAHCVSGYSHWKVYLGTILMNDVGSVAWMETSSSAKPHGGYDPSDQKNDVAVIHLKNCAPLNSYIRPIDLYSGNAFDYPFPGNSAIASGWGGSQNGTKYLYWAELSVISNTMCREYYKYINKKMLCTMHIYKNVCYGDVGGPLAHKGYRKYRTLIGITSYIPPNGCNAAEPAVYTRVASFIGWIKENTLYKKC